MEEKDCTRVGMSPAYARLLDDGVIGWRSIHAEDVHKGTLPGLLSSLAANEVRAFPRLRSHQRHPWHAFLVQVAAMAMHASGRVRPWTDAADWRQALLALTPSHPDGEAWSLVTPSDQPALLQPPVPGENVDAWKNLLRTPDELDMLVTSKNHDLKGARARHAQADDWLFALVSLQTQEGFLGAGNYGISRMNGGFASRPGVGIAPRGHWGERWATDVVHLLAQRKRIADTQGLATEGGHGLLWLLPWSGADSLSMESLDPFYVEICRRVRLFAQDGIIAARVSGSKAPRVQAKDRNGITGDPWTPIETGEAKALTVSAAGFDYKLMSELLAGSRFTHGAAWALDGWAKDAALEVIAQAVVRGQGKTEGYHERRLPVSPRLRSMAVHQPQALAAIARQRIDAIAAVRRLLWSALGQLFANGSGNRNDAIGDRASRFAKPFEQREDARFFEDLTLEVDADDVERSSIRLQWMQGLVTRAEAVLLEAFDAGPRAAVQRYKARAAALARFRGGLRGEKPALPDLKAHYDAQRALAAQRSEGEARE